LAIQTGLFSVLFFGKDLDKASSHLLSAFVGLFTSIIWLICDIKQIKSRDWWIDKMIQFEKDVVKDKKVWKEIKESCKAPHGLWKLISSLPIVFIVAWIIFIIATLQI